MYIPTLKVYDTTIFLQAFVVVANSLLSQTTKQVIIGTPEGYRESIIKLFLIADLKTKVTMSIAQNSYVLY